MAPAVKASSGIFAFLGGVFKTMGPVIGKIAGVLATAFAPVWKILAAVIKGFAGELVAMMPSLMGLARLFARVLISLVPLIPSLFKINIVFLQFLNAALIPLLPVITQLAKTVLPPLVKAFTQGVKIFVQMAPAITAIISGVSTLIAWLIKMVTGVGHVRRAWDNAVSFITTAFGKLLSGAEHMIGRVLSWFGSLPGKIIHGVASLGADLFKAGVRALEGLLHGMESVMGTILSKVGGFAHDIANSIGGIFGIHFSEPSQATQMVKAGRRVAEGLALGMDAGRGAATAAAGRLAGAAYPALAGAAGGRGGGVLEVEFRSSGEAALDALMNALLPHLRGAVRVHGGGSTDSVQKALGQRWM